VALTELITLKAGKDVEIVKESRVIDGELRDALVIRLVAATANDNPLSRYIGPCGTRPESENCNKVAVQGINTVGPDCDGNIDLEFRGVRSTPLEDNGPGVVLDHNLDLAEVCAAGKPEETVYQDLCESETSSGSSDAPSSGGPTPPDASSSLSSEAELCVDLPYLETFDDQATPMETIRGTFVFEEEDSPDEPFEPIGSSLASLSASASSEVAFGESWSLVAIDGSRDNLCLLPHCSDGNVERLVSAEMQLTRERVACNGGLILNYHETGDPDDRHIEYFLVLLDVTNVRFSIIRFNGQRYIIEQSVTVLPSDLNLWLHVEAEIAPGPDPETQTTITASIRTVGTPPELAATLTLTTNRYLPADGRFGVATREAKTRFSYFAIE